MFTRKVRESLKQLDRVPLPPKEKMLAFQAAASSLAPRTKGKLRRRFRPAVAACLALIILVGAMSSFAVAAEAREYNMAVGFFTENDLPRAGLTRSEIKEVYRDITTNRFSYGKTAQVLAKKVGGYEIFQDDPTPQDLESLWNYLKSGYNYFEPVVDGVSYKFEHVYKHDASLGFEVFEKTVVTKYQENQAVWNAELKDFVVQGYHQYGDKAVFYGHTSAWSSLQPTYGCLAMIDATGRILWETTSQNGFHTECYAKAFCDEGGITVFSRGDFNFLSVIRYDFSGQVTRITKNQVGNLGIWDAVRLGDSYLVQLYGHENGDLLVKVNSDGTLSDSFTYTAEDTEYRICSMLAFNGRVYLSAYAYPKLQPEQNHYGNRREIAAILDYIFTEKPMNIEPQELTKLVRSHYTAVLLVCDPQTGVPSQFYSVKSSLGSKLSVSEEGNMFWHVENITDTFFSPMTSSFTIGGASYVYRYTFDQRGMLVKQEKTGEVAPFRR